MEIEQFLDEIITTGRALYKNDDAFIKKIGQRLLECASVIANQHNYIGEQQTDIQLLSGKDFNNTEVVTDILKKHNELITEMIELRKVTNESRDYRDELYEQATTNQKTVFRQLAQKYLQTNTAGDKLDALAGMLAAAFSEDFRSMALKLAKAGGDETQ